MTVIGSSGSSASSGTTCAPRDGGFPPLRSPARGPSRNETREAGPTPTVGPWGLGRVSSLPTQSEGQTGLGSRRSVSRHSTRDSTGTPDLRDLPLLQRKVSGRRKGGVGEKPQTNRVPHTHKDSSGLQWVREPGSETLRVHPCYLWSTTLRPDPPARGPSTHDAGRPDQRLGARTPGAGVPSGSRQ